MGREQLGFVAKGNRIRTPYGVRLEWFLPNSNMPFIIHLKDGAKVKNKKVRPP